LNQTIEIADEAAMVQLGRQLAPKLAVGSIIFMNGDLGAGKTTFVKGLLQGLGHIGPVTSPTFTLVEPYILPRCRVYHFDLYRLDTAVELEVIGLRDMIGGDSITVFEWPERGQGVLPEPDVSISIEYSGTGRVVQISSDLLPGDVIESVAIPGCA